MFPGSTVSSESSGVLDSVLLVKLNPGDQVILDPIAIDAGEIVTAGSSCWTLPSERLCRRFPPMVRVPHPYRLEKFSELVICCVLSSGSTAFRLMIEVLVA